MKTPLALALLSVLATSAVTATAEEKIPNVNTVAASVAILSVDGAKVRAAAYDAGMRSYTALVDVAVTFESNVMCETKTANRMISVVPYPANTLSLIQECNVRKELTGLGFLALSMPRQTKVLVRMEGFLSPVRDPQTGKPVRIPGAGIQWNKEITETVKVPVGYQGEVKAVTLQYSLETKQTSLSIVDAPKAETKSE